MGGPRGRISAMPRTFKGLVYTNLSPGGRGGLHGTQEQPIPNTAFTLWLTEVARVLQQPRLMEGALRLVTTAAVVVSLITVACGGSPTGPERPDLSSGNSRGS